MEARYEIARLIVRKVADLEAGKLKKTAKDYISGMIAAYGILIREPDVKRAYEQAKLDAVWQAGGDDPQFEIVDE